MRQKLLMLYAHSPDLKSQVVAWSLYDGTGGDVAAMCDGWRVIQFPQQYPAYPGMEYNTSYLRYEYILERLEDSDG